jgi:Na+/glutamate symporter
MTPEEHDRLEEWAKKYAVLGLCGFLSLLLILGKAIRLPQISFFNPTSSGSSGGGSRPPINLSIPPAIVSGLIGLFWIGIMEYLDDTLTLDLNLGLDSFKLIMVNFMFASMILSLFCTRSSSQHSNSKALFLSILHEGIPMVIYSQILIWGQSSVCLLIYCLFYINSSDVPHLVSAMVPLGIEVGKDVIPTAVYKNSWSQTVVQEAETLGLFAACFLGVIAITVKNRYIRGPWNDSSSGRNDFYLRTHSGSADYEAFGRVSEPVLTPVKSRRSSSTTLTPSLSQRIPSNPIQGNSLTIQIPQNTQDKPLHSSFRLAPSSPSFVPAPSAHRDSFHSSLGTHISFIFISVFLAFCFGLFARIFESQYPWLKSHRILSSIRMFELSIFFSFLLIQFSLNYTKLTFKSEWYMRLCSLALDLVIIASLTSALPRPTQVEQVHYGLVGVFVLACALWNIFVFIFLGRKMFPNFWFERGITLTGLHTTLLCHELISCQVRHLVILRQACYSLVHSTLR